MSRSSVFAAGAPNPAGPYSHAIAASGEFVYLSGQIALDPATGRIVEGGIAAQTRQVFANLATVLDAAGLGFADAVKVGVFLSDMADFAEMNEVYASVFPEPFPARTTIAVAGMPPGAAVEIDLIAVRPQQG